MLCVEICSRLASMLGKNEKNERNSFVVHSVFDGAMNFKMPDGTIFALLAGKNELRPFTARVDVLPSGAEGLDMLLKCGAKIDLSLPEMKIAPGEQNLRYLVQLIEQSKNLSAVTKNALAFPQGRECSPIFFAIEKALSVRDAQMFNDAALGLCGLGEGLTPAGDDFLCGVLLALRASGAADLVDKFDIDKLRDRTNDISLMYIKCAKEGLTPRSLQSLLAALSSNSRALVAAHFNRAKQFGASSGVDICAGIAFALTPSWIFY